MGLSVHRGSMRAARPRREVPMGRLDGKVAIVTGGSAGIGRATAVALAREGAAVVVADVTAERGEAVAAGIEADGGRALFVRADVSDDGDVARMVTKTVESFGGLDAAFNNAGIEGVPAVTDQCSQENWARTIAVNLTGVWSCMRHEIPRMLERGGGSTVNCSSVAGLVGFAGIPAYVASKHGVVGLTKDRGARVRRAGHPGQRRVPRRDRHRDDPPVHT